jgi:flagellar protein FlaJ
MSRQMSWGLSFPETLRLLAERVHTPLVVRATALIAKATEAGGDSESVMLAAARDAREGKILEGERQLEMTVYVIVIYVAYLVFLGITAVLQGLFVPSMLHATGMAGGTGFAGLQTTAGISLSDFHRIYFAVAVVQGLGSGLVAGVMSEGNFAAGLKHASAMIAMAAVVYAVL